MFALLSSQEQEQEPKDIISVEVYRQERNLQEV